MARKYAVTRTVENTKAVALLFDLESAEAFNTTVTLGHKVEGDAAVERAVRKAVESTGKLKLIQILDYKVDSHLLGITEEDFMRHAVVLDPKTRKPYPATADTNDPGPADNTNP